MGSLQAWVAAGNGAPLIMLSGVADFDTIPDLIVVINGQFARGARHLIIDVSGLRLADSAAIALLLMTARLLAALGGSVVLVRPQPAVAEAVRAADPGELIRIGQNTPP